MSWPAFLNGLCSSFVQNPVKCTSRYGVHLLLRFFPRMQRLGLILHAAIMTQFRSSWLKIERANKYIAETELLIRDFAQSDFYAVRIENEGRAKFVCFDIDKSRFPFDDAALAIGDALHNLRTALDHLWNGTVVLCNGQATRYTTFPIVDSGEQLVGPINGALEQKQISIPVADLMLDAIRPYQGASDGLWSLHILDIRDKHKMLVPVLELMQFTDVRLEDDKGAPIGESLYIMDASSRIRIEGADFRNVVVKDKGHAAATVLFDEGSRLWGQPVVPALHWVAEEVSRTVKAFEILFEKS